MPSGVTEPISMRRARTLEEIDVELSRLTTKFSQNVLDATNAFELVLTDKNDVAGLPATALAAAKQSAARKGLEGWRFTLQAPYYFAVTTSLSTPWMSAAAVRRLQGGASSRPIHTIAASSRASWNCGARRRVCSDLPISPTWCWKTAWPIQARGRWSFSKTSRRKPFSGSMRRRRNCCSSGTAIEGPAAPELAPWDVAYYAEEQCAAKNDIDTKRRCVRTSPWSG